MIQSTKRVKKAVVANPRKRTKRFKAGWWSNGEKRYYVRSKWEYNFCYYLEFLKKQGKIKEWKYEPQTFWFYKIKRGIRSYKPDFLVFENGGTIVYYEVKGYMDSKSKTKLRRMKKYYPHIRVIVIDKKQYKAIMKFERLFKK